MNPRLSLKTARPLIQHKLRALRGFSFSSIYWQIPIFSYVFRPFSGKAQLYTEPLALSVDSRHTNPVGPGVDSLDLSAYTFLSSKPYDPG